MFDDAERTGGLQSGTRRSRPARKPAAAVASAASAASAGKKKRSAEAEAEKAAGTKKLRGSGVPAAAAAPPGGGGDASLQQELDQDQDVVADMIDELRLDLVAEAAKAAEAAESVRAAERCTIEDSEDEAGEDVMDEEVAAAVAAMVAAVTAAAETTAPAAAQTPTAPLPLRPSVSTPTTSAGAGSAGGASAEDDGGDSNDDEGDEAEWKWSPEECLAGKGRPPYTAGDLGPNPATCGKQRAACWKTCLFILVVGGLAVGRYDTGTTGATATHVCTQAMADGGICGHRFKLSRGKGGTSGAFSTTRIRGHNLKFHPKATSIAAKAGVLAQRVAVSLASDLLGPRGAMDKYVKKVSPKQRLFAAQVNRVFVLGIFILFNIL